LSRLLFLFYLSKYQLLLRADVRIAEVCIEQIDLRLSQEALRLLHFGYRSDLGVDIEG